ncbi:hypothetical protein EMCG_02702 [[Emmonsia] crescens]|uniref:Uncharacterized protein n=1 Tax=[Emmonsia] crescens TaxID=73230 RepID=A0A0G2HYV5_9EURO|nr:hypothetical protein EMCG_02702 [Emmonsia crescens UAMH 3008]
MASDYSLRIRSCGEIDKGDICLHQTVQFVLKAICSNTTKNPDPFSELVMHCQIKTTSPEPSNVVSISNEHPMEINWGPSPVNRQHKLSDELGHSCSVKFEKPGRVEVTFTLTRANGDVLATVLQPIFGVMSIPHNMSDTLQAPDDTAET